MDRAEFFSAKQIAEESRHTGEAAAVTGNDDKDDQLEDKGAACFCQRIKSNDLDQEKDYLSGSTKATYQNKAYLSKNDPNLHNTPKDAIVFDAAVNAVVAPCFARGKYRQILNKT